MDTSFSNQESGKIKAKTHKMKVKKHFDEAAPSCEKETATIQWEKYMIMIDAPEEGRILDLGCGTGLLQEFLQKKVYGVDRYME